MTTFNLTVVSAEESIFEGRVKSIQATGIEGELVFSWSYSIAHSN